MNILRKWTALVLSALLIVAVYSPIAAYADAAEGDVIIILGENLTNDQKVKVLADLEAPSGATELTVTNEEEVIYLKHKLAPEHLVLPRL